MINSKDIVSRKSFSKKKKKKKKKKKVAPQKKLKLIYYNLRLNQSKNSTHSNAPVKVIKQNFNLCLANFETLRDIFSGILETEISLTEIILGDTTTNIQQNCNLIKFFQ